MSGSGMSGSGMNAAALAEVAGHGLHLALFGAGLVAVVALLWAGRGRNH
jgi:hypothetical protein